MVQSMPPLHIHAPYIIYCTACLSKQIFCLPLCLFDTACLVGTVLSKRSQRNRAFRSGEMSRRSFTLDEKLKICARLRSGEKNSNLCKEFNVSSSTISTIYKHRDKWLKEETRLAHTRVKKFVNVTTSNSMMLF